MHEERLAEVLEDIDTRITALREAQYRIEDQVKASISATRSAVAIITADLGRLAAIVSDNNTGEKPGSGNSTTNRDAEHEKGGAAELQGDAPPGEQGDKKPVAAKPGHKLASMRRHRFL